MITIFTITKIILTIKITLILTLTNNTHHEDNINHKNNKIILTLILTHNTDMEKKTYENTY